MASRMARAAFGSAAAADKDLDASGRASSQGGRACAHCGHLSVLCLQLSPRASLPSPAPAPAAPSRFSGARALSAVEPRRP